MAPRTGELSAKLTEGFYLQKSKNEEEAACRFLFLLDYENEKNNVGRGDGPLG